MTRGAAITVSEKSPVGSSDSSGLSKEECRASKVSSGHILSAGEERLGIKIKLEQSLLIFMAEHAAFFFDVGKGGKTA